MPTVAMKKKQKKNNNNKKEMKLFPHFPGSQNFFDRLPNKFVLCLDKTATREASNIVGKNEMHCLQC